MEEIKIGVNKFGTLFAIRGDGSVWTILIDVHDAQHYGIARVGAPTESEDANGKKEESCPEQSV